MITFLSFTLKKKVFYLIFLFLFSYTILFDFNFEYEKTTNDTKKAKNMSKDDSSFSRIRIFETILLVWIVSLMLNELKEVKKN
jgi:hypothetical protein